MRRLLTLFLALMITVVGAAPVFAHAVGPTQPVDSSGYVKQAIVFLEGIQDTDTAQMDINNAMIGVGNGLVDQKKLSQALDALKKNNIDQSKVLLAESLGKDAKDAVELSYRPNYIPSTANTVVMILGGILLILGALIVTKAKPATNAMNSLSAVKAKPSV